MCPSLARQVEGQVFIHRALSALYVLSRQQNKFALHKSEQRYSVELKGTLKFFTVLELAKQQNKLALHNSEQHQGKLCLNAKDKG